MTLAALIAAYHDAAEEGLRATLPLAGRTVIERQARLAAAAGAHPIVVLVERLPAELLAALDRLRAEGVATLVARSVAEAADAIQPSDRLLVIGDGFVADGSHIARLKAAEGASVLTLPDQGLDDRFERIDARSRWAGLAMLDGGMLRHTAAMLEDWDLQSTLLRRALQSGARQFAVRADDVVTIAERVADLVAVQQRIVARARGPRMEWVSRYLLAPVEESGARLLMPTAVTPAMLYATAATLTGLAAILFTDDWRWAGLLLLLLATPLDAVAEKLSALRMLGGGSPRWWRRLMPALAAAALLALAHSVSAERGWGCLVLAAATLAFLAALRVERGDAEVAGRLFLAERKGMSWLIAPFALAGLWATGLGALAAYAAASFFWVQRQVHRAPPAGQD